MSDAFSRSLPVSVPGRHVGSGTCATLTLRVQLAALTRSGLPPGLAKAP
jgi:hypothetical protein